MSFTLQKAVWEYGPDNSTQHHVLLALADYADDEGRGIWPKIETIAQKCRVSESTAIRALNGLRKSGYIARQRRGQTSNDYQIQVDRLVPKSVNMTVCNPTKGVKSTEQDSPQTVKMTPERYQIDSSKTVKMTHDPINITNQLTDDYEPSPLDAIRAHFTARTAMLPNDRAGTYERDWRNPLEAILGLANNDPAAAVALIDRALAVARGDNETGKVYTVTCPRSLMSIAANLAATRQTAATAADDDSLWQRAIQAITRREYSDERLKAAIHAIGGSNRVAMANGHDTPTLKRQLAAAYRQALVPTG